VGLIVRPVGGYGLGEYLRVSIGLPAENDRLLRELPALLR
jgi:histidinol-phosphate aminotransferase